MPTLLVYGATGYTAGLVVAEALARGLRPVLAGRDARGVARVASALGLPHRVFSLDDAAAHLADVDVVLHAAGPFRDTWRPMVAACLRAGAHYLDLSGEVEALDGVARCDAEARARGVMLMPGVGFDVVPSDCLCALAASRLRGVSRVRIAVSGLELVSRGSLRTLASASREATLRRGGALVRAPLGSLERAFDFGDGPRRAALVAWGDVVTARYTTGAEDVEAYWALTPAFEALLAARRAASWWLDATAEASSRWAAMGPPGPSSAERASRRAALVVEVEDARGRVVTARAVTPEAYTLSASSAVEVAARALAGDVEPGFQTPGRVYGPSLLDALPGVTVRGPEGPQTR